MAKKRRLTEAEKRNRGIVRRRKAILGDLEKEAGRPFHRVAWDKLTPSQQKQKYDRAISDAKNEIARQKREREEEAERLKEEGERYKPEEPEFEEEEENEVDAYGNPVLPESALDRYERKDQRRLEVTLEGARKYQLTVTLPDPLQVRIIYTQDGYQVVIDYESTEKGVIAHRKDRHRRKGGDRHKDKHRKRNRRRARS